MEKYKFKTRINVMNISSVDSFLKIKGGINNNCKDVYFLQLNGVNQQLHNTIKEIDRFISENRKLKNGIYLRVNSLPALVNVDDVGFYSQAFTNWKNTRIIHTVCTAKNDKLQVALNSACDLVLDVFLKNTPNASESMIKNVFAKLLFWYDQIMKKSTVIWDDKQVNKIVLCGLKTRHEYLFAYMLTLTGIDVLLIQAKQDFVLCKEEAQFVQKISMGEFSDFKFEEYKDIGETKKKSSPNNTKRENKNYQKQESNKKLKEKEFEELALLASSIVMIAVHDSAGKIIGTGSGIMIGKDGYILTNNHVASGGVFYSVRIEDDDFDYQTDEVIKYNAVLDLAIIRIDKKLTPIPIYKGRKKLVRGQKVVAIGSPLGLFNSVSNGIISGFRNIESVDMIQFTAPISQGSSGGAVLNMHGEVVGISTAGIDRGQNINLAVGYESINSFIAGFH